MMLYRGTAVRSIDVDVRSVTVDWALGDTCNFGCSYCWEESHAGRHRPPPMTDLLVRNVTHLVHAIGKAWNDDGKPVRFVLGGGEPTLYRDLPDLLSLLRSLGSTMVLSNGSRTLRWWDEHCGLLDQIIITHHVGQSDYAHTRDLIRTVSGRTPVSLHVMLPDADLDRAVADYMSFIRDLQGCRAQLHGKVVVRDGGVAGYTDAQLAVIDSLPVYDGIGGTSSVMGNRVSMALADGTVRQWDDLSIIKDLHGSFSGYACWAPREYISIGHDGSCGVMNCRQRFTADCNIFSESFESLFSVPGGPVTCEMDHCRCLGLYETNKLAP